jgi:hypothetical protein
VLVLTSFLFEISTRFHISGPSNKTVDYQPSLNEVEQLIVTSPATFCDITVLFHYDLNNDKQRQG